MLCVKTPASVGQDMGTKFLDLVVSCLTNLQNIFYISRVLEKYLYMICVYKFNQRHHTNCLIKFHFLK